MKAHALAANRWSHERVVWKPVTRRRPQEGACGYAKHVSDGEGEEVRLVVAARVVVKPGSGHVDPVYSDNYCARVLFCSPG